MRRALVLCLLLAACRPDAGRHAQARPLPTISYLALGPVKMPLPYGWYDLGSDCPHPGERHCFGLSPFGPAVWGAATSGPTGQVHAGSVGGHPVHMGSYDIERSSSIVVTFDDADYGFVIFQSVDGVMRQSDRNYLEQLLRAMVDA